MPAKLNKYLLLQTPPAPVIINPKDVARISKSSLALLYYTCLKLVYIYLVW